MPPNDLSHSQLIATGFEIIGRALVDLHYAQRTTEAGQELLILAGELKAALPYTSEMLAAPSEGSAGDMWLRNRCQAASGEPIEQRRLIGRRLRPGSPTSSQPGPRIAQRTVFAGLSVLVLASLAVLLRKSPPGR